LQDALSFHNLWEQETNTLIITAKKVREGLRKVLGFNTIVKRINPKYMFGFEYYKYALEDREIYIPYSDIEKTFIDMIYFKQPLDEEIIENFKEKIIKKKLKEYLKRYPLRFRKSAIRRLGIWR
jgi:predicted transcriptional regulator of viral defense system